MDSPRFVSGEQESLQFKGLPFEIRLISRSSIQFDAASNWMKTVLLRLERPAKGSLCAEQPSSIYRSIHPVSIARKQANIYKRGPKTSTLHGVSLGGVYTFGDSAPMRRVLVQVIALVSDIALAKLTDDVSNRQTVHLVP